VLAKRGHHISSNATRIVEILSADEEDEEPPAVRE
jgi:hypothetical protein